MTNHDFRRGSGACPRPNSRLDEALRSLVLTAIGAVLLSAQTEAQSIPAELDGWPVIELTRATRSNGEVWVGTYGHGVLVHPRGAGDWRRIRSDTTSTSLSWDFVHAVAFGPRDQVWVGTIGNGWGLSRDDGATWRNWTFSELGPEWQYVAPEGIVAIGDTTVIATADGLQLTVDDGARWRAVVDRTGPAAKGPADSALAILRSEYFRMLVVESGEKSQVRTPAPGCAEGRVRRMDVLYPVQWLISGSGAYQENGRDIFGMDDPEPTTSHGLTSGGTAALAGPRTLPWAPWFGRPIRQCDNPHIDQTYRWGSTMGGNFQPHQGVEFNNPDGTPVLAIGPGVVAFSGPAERGALTVAIRHDSLLTLEDGSSLFVYSVYYHNNELLTQVGGRVARGDTIARVGHTGRATNDHLHLEVHASPIDSIKYVVDPEVRFPPYVTNPELWIEPLPGTGLIAGRVYDTEGILVEQTRIYGITKPEPRETPFAFAETYGPRNNPSPMYGENFAISDVPAGVHTLRAKIGDRWIERRVTVAPGVMTWVEFRP
jgi:murein DD-endopeptidase MepM/ murein hydrolase activator NlpD